VGEVASKLRLGLMSSVLVGGCNPAISGRDSGALAPNIAKLPAGPDVISITAE
jgi:hypothetical protein